VAAGVGAKLAVAAVATVLVAGGAAVVVSRHAAPTPAHPIAASLTVALDPPVTPPFAVRGASSFAGGTPWPATLNCFLDEQGHLVEVSGTGRLGTGQFADGAQPASWSFDVSRTSDGQWIGTLLLPISDQLIGSEASWTTSDPTGSPATVTASGGAITLALVTALVPEASPGSNATPVRATVRATCPAPLAGGIMGSARVELASVPPLPSPEPNGEPLPPGPLAPPRSFGGPIICDPPSSDMVVAAEVNEVTRDLRWAIGGGYYAGLEVDMGDPHPPSGAPPTLPGITLFFGYPGPAIAGLWEPTDGPTGGGPQWYYPPSGDSAAVSVTEAHDQIRFAFRGQLVDENTGGNVPPLQVSITGTCPAWPGHDVH
jgi:hypothetical protein